MAPDATDLQGDLWSAAGRDWAELAAPPGVPLWGLCLDLARVTRGTRVLDVGCGSGEALALARFRGSEVWGIDPASDLLRIAKERVPAADLRVGGMDELPYEDDAFDAVLHVNSLMYGADKVGALREARRVLADDGRLVVAVWGQEEECEFRHVMAALVGLLPEAPRGEGPFALSPPGALEKLLGQAGLEPVEAVEVPGPFVYADQDHYLGAALASGPARGVVRQVGEETVTEALLDAGDRFVHADGSVRIENAFRVVAARRA